jgi:hypothetical protein
MSQITLAELRLTSGMTKSTHSANPAILAFSQALEVAIGWLVTTTQG